ncbi:MAG: patatin-like phospholipase family protein [Syntrophobacteraceae bacterium]|nr:patatin-like phospholipase family protein [Syntrophobacteraceae bacterium]
MSVRFDLPRVLFCAVAMAALLASGCGTLPRLPAVPHERLGEAVIPGIPDARIHSDFAETDFARMGQEAFEREKAFLAASGHRGPLPPVSFLAVSGGGDDGAFGAGLLVGWTAAGDRPEFKAVTGISTGALIAPFAFLGPDYDHVLRHVYTNVSRKDIFKPRNLLTIPFKDAAADTTPLWSLLSLYVDQKMLDAVAAEYRKGRLLLIGTTDLDSRKGVIWNMGQIAASGAPQALDLFRKIMLASASIPGAFPPVLMDVEVNGKAHQEMHVDGGTVAQVFIYPPSFKLGEMARDTQAQRERTVYIIRNARLDPQWTEVQRRTLSIIGRAISSLIQNQGRGDLVGIYYLSQRDGLDFNLAYIPPTFNEPHLEDFDMVYMRKLFNVGYEMAVAGYPWENAPPVLNLSSGEGSGRKNDRAP